MKTKYRSIGAKLFAGAAIVMGALGAGVLTAAPASAATTCNLSWANEKPDVVGTCRVDPGKKVTVKVTCQSLPGYQAFTKTKVIRASQSFVWDSGCHKPFYSKGKVSYSVSKA
ncbi:hypothetical protein KZC51_16390 [Microbacterium sp. SSW1-49]|uniref:Uncharacterized protein n=1 Tax=Microbacterium croceum TaxID=2851645 RepID=A0ABT0FI20_9MICO|nr:hypothetical protein [Microbacterium croceum]MCK2037708.1 hypothetical protein [Microbacterium croceum]